MKVLLVHDSSCHPELKKVENWLKAAGCEVLFFDLTLEAHEMSLINLINECDVVVFLMSQHLPMEDAKIGIVAAMGKGKKIIGVQLSGTSTTKEFGKYASALIQYDQKAVVASVCGDSVEWTNTKGEKRADRKTKRHKC